MSKPNYFLMNRIVEHIREVGIEHDTSDIEEFGIMQIIGHYGWHPILSSEEKQIIKDDLWDLALRMEVAEVVRSMQDTDEYIAVYGNRPACEVCPELDVSSFEEPVLA